MGIPVVAQPVTTTAVNNIVSFGRVTLSQTPAAAALEGTGVGTGVLVGGAILGGVAIWSAKELIFTDPVAVASIDGLQKKALKDVLNNDLKSPTARQLAEAIRQAQKAFPGQSFEVVQGTNQSGDYVLALQRGDTTIPLMEGLAVVSRITPIRGTIEPNRQQQSPEPKISPSTDFRQEQQIRQQSERIKEKAEVEQSTNQTAIDKAWSGSSLHHLQTAYGSLKGAI